MELPDSIPALLEAHPEDVSITPLTNPANAAAATIDPFFAFIVCLVL